MAYSFSIDPDETNNLSNNIPNNLSSIFNFKNPSNMNQNININNNNNSNIEDTINQMNDNYKNGVPMALSVFHPMCGHCHSMRPDWENAGKQLENEYKKKVMIGLIHKDYVNKLPIKQENIRGYPHIVFISKKGEKEYQGMRNVNAFKDWIKENANSIGNVNKTKTKKNKKTKTKRKRTRIRIHKPQKNKRKTRKKNKKRKNNSN
jgi:thioredoxin-like negative regulator of GroEL